MTTDECDMNSHQKMIRVYRSRVESALERLTWPIERRLELRDQRLRELIHVAQQSSPWHARRLKHIDPSAATAEDLLQVPPMTKKDLMDNWDDIVTDRRVTLEAARSHLRSVATGGHRFLSGRHSVVESGGTSGSQGVFAWDLDGWIAGRLGDIAGVAWLARRNGWQDRWVDGHEWAYVGSSSDTHMARAERTTFRESEKALFLGADRPVGEIVERLNAFGPEYLFVYPSILRPLNDEALSGRLRISPKVICTGSETLPRSVKRGAQRVFGAPVVNNYASSECGTIAHGRPGTDALHLIEENVVLQPAGDAPAGAKWSKVLVTNVINKLLPLIRYEVEDEIRLCPADGDHPWTGRRVDPPERDGIAVFTYPAGKSVHPHAFRTILGRLEQITQYQVRQRPNGVEIALESTAPVHASTVASAIGAMLRTMGLSDPEVRVLVDEPIARAGASQKVRHFIPLER